jgi:hypothetical protein
MVIFHGNDWDRVWVLPLLTWLIQVLDRGCISRKRHLPKLTCGAQCPAAARVQLLTRPPGPGRPDRPLSAVAPKLSPSGILAPTCPAFCPSPSSPPAPHPRRSPPPHIFQRRSGNRMAMATQTGFATSKVLILVGAGPSLAATSSARSPLQFSLTDWMRFLPIGCCFVS